MPQWEYTTVIIHLSLKSEKRADRITKRLNAYGTDGWELVNFEWDGKFNILAIFKRPLPAQE